MLFFFLLVLITTAYDSNKVKKLSFEDTLGYLDRLVQSDIKEVDGCLEKPTWHNEHSSRQ